MIRRRPFLLLELLIALTLVMFLSVYLIRSPMYQLKQEIEALIELEMRRKWLLQLMEWRQNPPEPWDKFVEKESQAEWKEVTLKVECGAVKRNRVAKYCYWMDANKKELDGTVHCRARFMGEKEHAYDFFMTLPSR